MNNDGAKGGGSFGLWDILYVFQKFGSVVFFDSYAHFTKPREHDGTGLVLDGCGFWEGFLQASERASD